MLKDIVKKKFKEWPKKTLYSIAFILLLLLVMSPELAFLGMVDVAIIDAVIILLIIQLQLYADIFWIKFLSAKSFFKTILAKMSNFFGKSN